MREERTAIDLRSCGSSLEPQGRPGTEMWFLDPNPSKMQLLSQALRPSPLARHLHTVSCQSPRPARWELFSPFPR